MCTIYKTQIDSEVANVCNTTKTCESSNCVHCHLIGSTDVSTAVSKLKTDKVNDNGMIYSNNFIHRTKLLFQYLGLLHTSMVYHGYCHRRLYVPILFQYLKDQRRICLILINIGV